MGRRATTYPAELRERAVRMVALKRENADLRQANVLMAASAFLAAEVATTCAPLALSAAAWDAVGALAGR